VSSAWPARDAAIVSVLADCGLRVSELCALTRAAIDDNGELPLVRVRAGAKGGKAGNVLLPCRTHVRLHRHLRERDAPTAPLLGCSSAATVGEHYWRIGAYVDGDTVVDAVAPGVELLFIRRRLSRYVHLMG